MTARPTIIGFRVRSKIAWAAKWVKLFLTKVAPSDLHFSLHPANPVEHLEKPFSTENYCMKTLEQIEFGHVRCEGDTCLKLNV